LALDTENHVAYYKGEKIALTQKEFALLALLYENRGTPVSREHALAEVFSDAETKTNVVDVYVNYLRTKIDSRFDVRMISTVRGLGYVIAK
jgi:DNA-binding response OmpR family regulator